MLNGHPEYNFVFDKNDLGYETEAQLRRTVHGIDLDGPDGIEEDFSPQELHSIMCDAASRGWNTAIREMIETGIWSPHARCRVLDPLGSAAMHGKESTVKLLIHRYKVDIHGKRSSYRPIALAIRYGHFRVAHLLLDCGATFGGEPKEATLARICFSSWVRVTSSARSGTSTAAAEPTLVRIGHQGSLNGYVTAGPLSASALAECEKRLAQFQQASLRQRYDTNVRTIEGWWLWAELRRASGPDRVVILGGGDTEGDVQNRKSKPNTPKWYKLYVRSDIILQQRSSLKSDVEAALPTMPREGSNGAAAGGGEEEAEEEEGGAPTTHPPRRTPPM